MKEFKALLSIEDVKELERLRRNKLNGIWQKENPEKAKARNIRWRKNNPEKDKEVRANWRKQNPEKDKKVRSFWRAKNQGYSTNIANKRRQEDPLFRFWENIRQHGPRVVRQLALGKKPISTEKWVGCTASELRAHFEILFVEGMSWDNYGQWEIDHIRPVSSFSQEEWRSVNHYTNLQPLWAADNLKKRDSWN